MRRKTLRVERLLKRVHGHVQQMAARPDVQLHVVFGRLDPVDILHVHEDRLARRTHRQPLQIALRRGDGLEQRQNLPVGVVRRLAVGAGPWPAPAPCAKRSSVTGFSR